MVKKTEKHSVSTYPDHEVITPPHALKTAVSVSPDSGDDPIARAERALAQLSPEFSNWMDSELKRLDKARQDIMSKGFDQTTRDALFHAVHDIKGEAATFGYPAVAATAESLCRLVEHSPDMTRIPLRLVEQHVDAIRAIVRENGEPNVGAMADKLTRRLREVTDDFLSQANKHRPEYLEGIISPPLAPGENF
jgi:HPt (histidine-containing phosphotransfer) domain-containing protein